MMYPKGAGCWEVNRLTRNASGGQDASLAEAKT